MPPSRVCGKGGELCEAHGHPHFWSLQALCRSPLPRVSGRGKPRPRSGRAARSIGAVAGRSALSVSAVGWRGRAARPGSVIGRHGQTAPSGGVGRWRGLSANTPMQNLHSVGPRWGLRISTRTDRQTHRLTKIYALARSRIVPPFGKQLQTKGQSDTHTDTRKRGRKAGNEHGQAITKGREGGPLEGTRENKKAKGGEGGQNNQEEHTDKRRDKQDETRMPTK